MILINASGCSRNSEPYEGAQVAFENRQEEDLYELEVEKKRLENRIEYLEREAIRMQPIDSAQARRIWIDAARAKERLNEINRELSDRQVP